MFGRDSDPCLRLLAKPCMARGGQPHEQEIAQPAVGQERFKLDDFHRLAGTAPRAYFSFE